MNFSFSRKQTAVKYSNIICSNVKITIDINRVLPEFILAESTPDAAELATAS